MSIAYTAVDTEKLIDVTEKLAKINNEQGVAITVMSLMLVVMVIAFFILLFTVIKSPKKDKEDLNEVKKTQALIISILDAQKDNVCEIRDDTKAMAVSLRIHTQQNKAIAEKIKEIFDCLLKKLLKGGNQDDSSTAGKINQPGE